MCPESDIWYFEPCSTRVGDMFYGKVINLGMNYYSLDSELSTGGRKRKGRYSEFVYPSKEKCANAMLDYAKRLLDVAKEEYYSVLRLQKDL